MRIVCLSLLALFTLCRLGSASPGEYFAIQVVDEATGRGVPLVELTTTFEARYYTDSDGYVAFNEPGLMTGDDVWFDVRSYGYESPKGPIGGKGVALKPKPGASAQIKLKRTNIAERLYRITGAGIFRDSVLLGNRKPTPQATLNARVTGQDTVQVALYNGKYYWFWQDTDQAGFHLGCFSMTGATAPPLDKVDPDQFIEFSYFVDKPGAFARAMARVPLEGNHPIWADGMTVVKDDKGEERMLSRYVAVDKAMKPVRTGLLLWNDQKQVFEVLKTFDGDGAGVPAPSGHPTRIRDGIVDYIYFPGGDSVGLRVKADFASVCDPAAYEAFTCLNGNGVMVRRADGMPDWKWTRGVKRLTRSDLRKLVDSRQLKEDELPVRLRDVDTGKAIEVAGGSIAWNEHLHKWLYVFGQSHGDSLVGEVWIATANAPEGPWRACRKVATHAMPDANNDFYNVIQNDELARGQYVYFQGTFVNTFSGNKTPTPYYNYNNIMYRVDLDDPRLKLPEPPPGLTDVKPAK
ncbi:MAG: hypothetical protein QM770_15205 [Tepidisphaeraceae bacterium]